jgi:hypothetical protein
MTDIGLPLGRSAAYDLAGFSRHALRTIAPPAVAAVLDRKSTRLNSSHQI